MKAIEKLQGLTDQIRHMKEQIAKDGATLIGRAAKEILDQYPAVVGFQWTQYTPYFNDGNPCEFSVGELYVFIEDPEKVKEWAEKKAAWEDKNSTAQGLSEEQLQKLGIKVEPWVEPGPFDMCKWGADEGEYVSTYDPNVVRERAKYGPCWNDIVSLAKWIGDGTNEDVMETVFGDHVKVSITRNGVETKEYKHD